MSEGTQEPITRITKEANATISANVLGHGATTIFAKHIFLDIVGFTSKRSVEAQSDIVYALNKIVKDATKHHSINKDKIIYLPTGDGMVIVLLNIYEPYDIHISIALRILELLYDYNEKIQLEIHNSNEERVVEKAMRQFEVRIGLNENVDNLVIDINDNKNIAGAGINIAQRIMDLANGNQLLVGQSVFDVLQSREKYMHAFNSYTATIKHNKRIQVYQLVDEKYKGLNIKCPTAFEKTPLKEITKLSEKTAYYFALLIIHEAFIEKLYEHERGAILPLFWFWVIDAIGLEKQTRANSYSCHSPGIQKTVNEQFAIFNGDKMYYVIRELKDYIMNDELDGLYNFFEDPYFSSLINDKGKNKLKEEYPEIMEKAKKLEGVLWSS